MRLERILLGIVLMSACATREAEPPPAVGQKHPSPNEPALVASSKDAAAAIVEGETALAETLYGKLREGKRGNFAFSPSSIGIAFGMTYAGARGETARQMADALRYKLPQEEIHGALGAQLRRWNDASPSRAYELTMANRLFGEQAFAFRDTFVGLTAKDYQAEIEPVDFRSAPESARLTINRWVSDRTKEKIVDLLPEGSIKPITRLVLTNAVYMKARWKQPFPESLSAPDRFRTPSGDVTVPMMHHEGRHRHAARDGVQVLELAYEGDDLVMQILLPDDAKGFGALEQKLAAGGLDDMANGMSDETLAVSLPRFAIRPSESLSLKETFQSLGMVDAFDRQKADFGEMADTGGLRLFIDDAFHKAFVDVRESGTEAAAASAVVVAIEGAAAPSLAKPFTVDHPFAFAIRDRASGAVLFLGRVTNPTAG